MSHQELPLADLVQLCKEANASYFRKQGQDTRYAYELFRRALAERHSEALHEVMQMYLPQLRRWVRNHPAFESTDETEEHFASEAFTRFYFALQGERFARFKSVAAIMQYMKLCVFTAVMQYARDHANTDVPLPDADIADGRNPLAEVDASALRAQIDAVLTTDKQRRLAHLAFVLDMKPAEIVREYPNEWDNERSVSIALYRVRKLLRADPRLQGWLLLDTEPAELQS
jgi:hypothetical protein